jgi:hypothetical protein
MTDFNVGLFNQHLGIEAEVLKHILKTGHLKTHFLVKKNMENSIKLKDEHIKTLENLPEQGMGYQIVDITLKNGIVLCNRIVFNSSYLKLNATEKIELDDIIQIDIIQNDWVV